MQLDTWSWDEYWSLLSVGDQGGWGWDGTDQGLLLSTAPSAWQTIHDASMASASPPPHDHHHHPHDAPAVTSGRVSALTFARRVRLRRRKTYRYHCCHCWSRETHFLQFMIHFHNLFHFRLCTHVEALCKTTITQPPFQYEGWFLRLTDKRTDKAFVSRGKHICTTVAPVYQL